MFSKTKERLENTEEINNAVLERIVLLESQVASLQEEAQQNKKQNKAIKSENSSIKTSSQKSEETNEAHELIIDEDIGEINGNARKPRNFRISDTSLLTKRIYADDDFKVRFLLLFANTTYVKLDRFHHQ